MLHTTKAALPQNRVETLIGSQANNEIKMKIRDHYTIKSIQH